MNFKHIVITGGAGFAGANLLQYFREAWPALRLTGFDNLRRRGSELNLPRLKKLGVDFVHGDVRCPEDFLALPAFDLLIDCSAEPSVQAGVQGDAFALLNNNLAGTIQCLEAARAKGAAFLFLSTSRVYPIQALNGLRYAEAATRYVWEDGQSLPGCSMAGISEEFPLAGPRSLYGGSKLAGELLLQEYVYSYKMPALINRCGILAGPWQMGKVDQGVISLWVARHHFGKDLSYNGFGGQGKQVRDVLHIRDFFELLAKQMEKMEAWDGRIYNVGGGLGNSISLAELTALCQATTGRRIKIASRPETSPLDLRIYLTDTKRVRADFNWSPQRNLETVAGDIQRWLQGRESELAALF